jgi:hypothetical protein
MAIQLQQNEQPDKRKSLLVGHEKGVSFPFELHIVELFESSVQLQ